MPAPWAPPARWVPPKPPKRQSPPPAPSPLPEQQKLQSPEVAGKKKSKKSEKRRNDEEVSTEQKRDTPERFEDPTVEDVSAKSPKLIKKPKKRKREHNVEEPEEEVTPKKHKSILAKFEKASKRAKTQKEEKEVDESADHTQGELRDLEPLPQPAPVPDPAFEPTFSVLPAWLEHPITVPASKRTPFSELEVRPFFVEKLEKQGITEALAVQSALLPMLHPGFEQHLGDICVAAKTGSGKTLAYLLPIVEALKDRATTNLSAIVVVPTRKLVDQALQVAEGLCVGTKIKVGTALGTTSFALEKKQLVRMTAQYDPQRAQELHERADRQMETGFVERGGIIEDLMSMPVGHVPRYESCVDILICTPGRLVEHIESTTGFLPRSVNWLVIDEADQLLNHDFQGWATVLMDALHGETPDDFRNAQERLRKQRQGSAWAMAVPARRQITKVVLSATIERNDLTKLGMLRLKRPKMVHVQEEPGEGDPVTMDGDVFELPSELDEFAVRVGDGLKKPLYLLYFLLNHVFKDSSDEQESSASDSLSDSSSDEESHTTEKRSISKHKSRVLVFTKSNESASRLAHLLSVLEPPLKDYLKTMAPSLTAKASKKLLRSFSSGEVKILIASDAVSRGLDVPDITHVVNYDIPRSVISYVHRVGRTARAGKAGEAWSLITKTEAAWFWNQLARGVTIRRGAKKIKRVEWKEWNVTYNRKRTYDAALAELQEAVEGITESTE